MNRCVLHPFTFISYTHTDVLWNRRGGFNRPLDKIKWEYTIIDPTDCLTFFYALSRLSGISTSRVVHRVIDEVESKTTVPTNNTAILFPTMTGERRAWPALKTVATYSDSCLFIRSSCSSCICVWLYNYIQCLRTMIIVEYKVRKACSESKMMMKLLGIQYRWKKKNHWETDGGHEGITNYDLTGAIMARTTENQNHCFRVFFLQVHISPHPQPS